MALRRSALLALLILGTSLLTGCAATAFGPRGILYTNTRGPVSVSEAEGNSAVGRATTPILLGIATGNASVQAAMANGGITRVHHVDYEATLVLGLFGSYTVVVYGERGAGPPPAPPDPPSAELPFVSPEPAGPAQADLPILDVETVQRTLNENGFRCGTPDGVFGGDTRRCLRAFQQREGLPVTGTLDQATSDAIRRIDD